jgi:serine protease Do
LIGRDPKTDLAVLKVENKKPLAYVPMGDSEKARVGDWVIAIGNPFGLGGSLSAGIISAINRDINAGPYDSFIQTDAAINRGNSGGPLFNMQGEVIGVNSAIISPSGGSVGIGFSIPSNLATSVVAQLREYGETRRGWLGVRIQAVTDELAESLGLGEARGALVSEVSPDGPADKGGVKVGDVIVKFDGKAVPTMRDLPRIVAETKIDKPVRVEVVRRGKSKRLSIVTGRLEEPDLAKATQGDDEPKQSSNGDYIHSGLTLQNINPQSRRDFELGDKATGALVVDVDRSSAAFEAGIRTGDVVAEIDQQPVGSAKAAVEALEKAEASGRKSALVFVQSRGTVRFIALPLSK